MNQMISRMARAAKLDRDLYEEVETDTTATGQAMGVVILSSVAAGIGSFREGLPAAIVIGTLVSLISWYFWAFLTYVLGTKVFPEPQTQSNIGELLRTTGYSSAPGILRVLGVVPGIAPVVFLAAAIWMLVSMVVAVRQALDYESTWRAVGVCVIGWMIQTLLILLVFQMSGTKLPVPQS